MKRNIIQIFAGVVIATTLSAQITVAPNTTAKVTGELSFNTSFNNNSSESRILTDAHLFLTGNNQTLNTSSPVSLQTLTVDGGGTKTLQGEWTVTRDLTFTQGIVTIGSGKLVYEGASTLEGHSGSFVNGVLFQRGTGTRFYPIGAGTTYAPMAFGNIQDGSAFVGVRAFTSGASLTLPPDINAIANNRYWEVTTSAPIRGSSVSLYTPGSSIDASQQLAVVEADDANGATAINLGGGVTGDFVVSFDPATKPILTIGITETVDLRINDLITPFTADDINDKLKIVNIHYTFENTVTLLDRWGVPVKKWKNFSNYDDPTNPNTDNFDFSGLSPGNYICVLEYHLTVDSPKKTMTQMISVLK